MIQKIKITFTLLLCAVFFGAVNNISAQTVGDETVAVSDSKLAEISLPSGALRVKEERISAEIKETLNKLIAAGGEKVRQSGSEVIVWEGNYTNTKGTQMIKKLENALQNSGWEYEIGERNSEFVLFSLFRTAPERRALLGFFVPSSEAFVFALTEMVRADALTLEAEDQTTEEPPQIKTSSNKNDLNIYGKWFRTVGGGFRDYTGKTKYNAGEDYYFEFFPDGTFSYLYKKNVLSIMQCKITGEDTAKGKFSINGNTLTIDFGPMKSVQTNSCDSNENFNRMLKPSQMKVQFEVKKMESLARPDNPTIMCFEGSDNVCYEKTN